MRKIKYKENLCSEYVKKINSQDLQDKWKVLRDEIVAKYPGAANIYKENVADILSADFALITKIYEDAINLSEVEKAAAKRIFNYDYDNSKLGMIPKSSPLYSLSTSKKYNADIAEFFITNADKLHISACYYCEMNYVFPYKAEQFDKAKNKFVLTQKRMFDLDHFFEKKDSPITALSFYNFIPSCQVCNSRIKGKRSLVDFYHLDNVFDGTIDFSKLSPSSSNYAFDENVKIKVDPQSISFISNDKNNIIIFDTSDISCKRIISAFQLKERYNYSIIKKKALQLKEIKENCTDGRVKAIKDFFPEKSEDEIRNFILHKDDDIDEYDVFSKIKRDILDASN